MRGIFKSKTLLVNSLFIGFMLISKYTNIDIPEELRYKLIGWLLDPEVQNAIIVIMNIILRFFTKKPVKHKKSFME